MAADKHKLPISIEEQKRLLGNAILTLSRDITSSPPEGGKLVLKHGPSRRYLVIDQEQDALLRRFAQGTSVADMLPRLIADRKCPALGTLYELVLKALLAGVLEDSEKRYAPPPAPPALRWPLGLAPDTAQFIGVFSLLAGFFALLLTPTPLPDNLLDLFLGLVLASLALSAGEALAACAVVGSGHQITRADKPRRFPLPHFRLDLEDARMGGSPCETAVGLLRMSPAFLLAALASLWLPALKFPALLSVLLATEPFGHTPLIQMLRGVFRRQPLSTEHDFAFVCNRVFLTLLNKSLHIPDRRYLLVLAVYTLAWLGTVFEASMHLLHRDAPELLSSTHASGPVLLMLLIGMALSSAGTWLWIIARNTVRLAPSRRPKTLAPASTSTTEDLLKSSLLFSQLDKDTLCEAARRTTLIRARRGQAILRQGEPGDALYIIGNGGAEVIHELPEGGERLVARLHPGDVFGEIALLDNVPRTRTVRATKTTHLLRLSKADFEALVLTRMDAAQVREILQRRAFFYRIPLSRHWHPDAIERFAALTRPTRHAKGATLIRFNRENQFFYIVYEGTLDVVHNGKTLSTLRPGDFFGELSLLQHSAATSDVIAREDGICLTVHRSEFLRFIAQDFLVSLQFEAIGSERLHHAIFPLDGAILDMRVSNISV